MGGEEEGTSLEDLSKQLFDEPEDDDEVEDGEEAGGDDLDPEEALQQVQDFFDQFVPPDKLVIEGVYGGKYPVPMRQKGRVQIVVMREMKKLMGQGISMPSFSGGGAMQMLEGVLELAANEEFVASLELCFSTAYPKLIEAEAKLAKEQGDETDGTALDLFSIEEAIKVFAPLLAALMTTGQGLTNLIPSQ